MVIRSGWLRIWDIHLYQGHFADFNMDGYGGILLTRIFNQEWALIRTWTPSGVFSLKAK
jgi:hypothetical protein